MFCSRNGSEIYRIVPEVYRIDERVVTFPTPGLEVDKSRSGLAKSGVHHLHIRNITRGAGGVFVCQVGLLLPLGTLTLNTLFSKNFNENLAVIRLQKNQLFCEENYFVRNALACWFQTHCACVRKNEA